MFDHWLKFSRHRSATTSRLVADVADPRPHSAIGAGASFLVRQPVVDAAGHLVGHDVAFRADPSLPGQDAVLNVLAPEFCAIIRRLADSLPVQQILFLRMDASLLTGWLDCFSGAQVVPAIDMAEVADFAPFVDMVEMLAKQGVTVALDNLPDIPAAQVLLPLAKFLRFETRRYDMVELERQMAMLIKWPAMCIALQVESEDEYEACRVLGFQAFQGYFFTQVRPEMPRRIDHDRLHVIRLLNLVAQHAEMTELDTVIRRDAVLAYRLLSYINSPLSGLDHPLESITQALYFLGYNPLYRWLTVLLFTSGNLAPNDRLLLYQALLRGRLCELLAQQHKPPMNGDSLFVVGMFSLLDALFNVPMAQVLEFVTLAPPMQRALCGEPDVYTDILHLAQRLEDIAPTVEADVLTELAARFNMTPALLNRLQVEALSWVREADILHNDGR